MSSANTMRAISRFDQRLQSAKQGVAQLRAKLETEDPLNALSWADDTFKDAARVKVYTYCIEALKSGVQVAGVTLDVSHVLKYAQDEVLRRSRYPHMSTSVPSNLAATYELAAWAEVIDLITNWGLLG